MRERLPINYSPITPFFTKFTFKFKRMKYPLLAATLFASTFALAQTTKKIEANTQKFICNPKATVVVRDVKEDFAPKLMNLEKPKPGGIPKNIIPYQPKAQLRDIPGTVQNESLTDVGMGMNFNGNPWAFSTPCDNDFCISDSGKAISAVNTTLYFYDVSGSSPVTLSNMSFAAFSAPLGLPHEEFDPKLLYDPNEDKFIVVVLNGFTDTTSSIIVGFSQTNDPTGAWNLYALPGNPLNNGLWTDYPILGLTDNELFITVNLLYPDSSWQTGFNESVIWQMNKFNGYNNDPLNANLITGVQFNGKNIRNLCPVKGGSQLYGPDMYFLSNRNFEVQGDTVFLVHVLDTAGAAGFGVTVTQLNSDRDYFFCGDARQVGTHKFATNDSRMLGAFIENDKIQYVHNSMDTSTTWCSIYHGIISNVSTSPVVNGMLITDTLRDFGYPNISYAGVSGTDNSAIIHFDHCAPSVHAGVSAVKTDGNFNYSNTKKIVDGTSYVNVLGGPQERWGDYSGSQRKYNVPGEVWVSGYMGYASGVNRVHRAYIAQLSTNPTLSTTAPITAEETTTHVFPNPFENMISVDFDMEKREYLTFDITDMTGKRVHLLMREYVKAGKDRFSFSIEDLAPGMYMFNITAKDRVISSTKIVRK